MSRLPNFFLAGAPKAGTTSLYHYLGQHPQIFMSPVKEPHYFAAEIRKENFAAELRQNFEGGNGIVADWQDYLRLFARASQETAVGEASVCYLWSPSAPNRILERIPDAKILVVLRDPADRAFSQYLHGLRVGAIRWSLREHVDRNLRHKSRQLAVHYPFLEFGMYAEQLGRYRERFGSNVWVGLYEDFKTRPQDVFKDICRFLGVSTEFLPDMSRQHMEAQVPRWAAANWLKRSGLWQAAARITPPSLRPGIRRAFIRPPGATRMDAVDRKYLVDYYREDIQRLAKMLQRNLDHWL